ncbi:MAG: hypothetical protein HZA90_28780 [Verrucomicrobia bacterium]|nr:hypothetical protein [Verrucomicrobiota bacterium]
MTRDEAKLILQACRPGGQDAANPRCAEAMALAQTDPELAAWLAQERAFDASISAKLKSNPVPPNLRTAILAGEKVIRQLAWWHLINWRRVAACAAILVVGVAAFLFSLNKTQTILAATDEAIEIAQSRVTHLSLHTNNLAGVRQFFSKCRAPADFDVPSGLRKLPVMGGTLVGVQYRTASVVCFRITGQNYLTLFVMDELPDGTIPPEGEIKFVAQGEWTTAIWNEKGKTYMVHGKVHPNSLRRMLTQGRGAGGPLQVESGPPA